MVMPSTLFRIVTYTLYYLCTCTVTLIGDLVADYRLQTTDCTFHNQSGDKTLKQHCPHDLLGLGYFHKALHCV